MCFLKDLTKIKDKHKKLVKDGKDLRKCRESFYRIVIKFEEQLREFRSELPRGVQLRGLGVWQRVEHVLDDLGTGYRLACAVEYGILRPDGEPVKLKTDRAALLGVSPDTYRRRLRIVRQRLG